VFTTYLAELFELAKIIGCTGCDGVNLDIAEAVNQVVLLLEDCRKNGRKIMWVGNGGSAAIAAHSAIDYMRTAGIKSLDFNAGPLLTCLSNDFGYSQVFVRPIEMFATQGDLLVAISSSGRSENIINAVTAARKTGCRVITLSGFAGDNPLREKGDLNFYVRSSQYGQVELLHGILCHSFLDILMLKNAAAEA
jgi:D-sedoheptulose 7-phosphate isomerase